MLENEIEKLSETLQQEQNNKENVQKKLCDLEEINYILKSQVCMVIYSSNIYQVIDFHMVKCHIYCYFIARTVPNHSNELSR